MSKTYVRLPVTLIGVLSAFSSLAFAEDKNFDADVELSAGVSADSDVGIPDLDRSSDQGDLALLLGAKLDASVKPVDRLTLRTGYEFTQTSYQDLDAFDLQTHRASAEAEYDFTVVRAGVLGNFVHARLDDGGYLDYTQASPYVSRLLGKSVYVRAAYVRTDKDFKTDDGRDAEGDAGRLDAYFLIDGTEQYMSLGGEVGKEDATSNAFDLTTASAKARYIQKFAMLGRDAKMRLGAEYEQRDYDNPTPSLGENREDRILAAEGSLEVPVAGPLSMDVGYSYRDRQSNLDTADYDEHVGRVKLKVGF